MQNSIGTAKLASDIRDQFWLDWIYTNKIFLFENSPAVDYPQQLRLA